MRDLGQLHVDLLRQDGDGVTPESGDHHRTEVSDVLALPEGRDSTPDAISGLEDDDLHAKGLELLRGRESGDPGADDDDLSRRFRGRGRALEDAEVDVTVTFKK